ncbi:MAG: efflux RND transporter permease subunit [Bacteriovoracia bacterium]
MIEKIVRFSVYNRGVVLFLTTLIALLGWYAFQDLPIDAVPDITNVQVQINTPVEGLAPEEIERYVTAPTETAMGGVVGVTEVRSITKFGLSQVTVNFEDGTNIYLARQLISERLQSIMSQLPKGVHPKLGPISTGLGEIYHYTVLAEKPESGDARIRQLMEIRALQDWFIKPRLLTVKGVAEVNTIGGFDKEFHIQPDPKKMAQYGIHFSDLIDAMERTNKNLGGAYVQQTGDQFLVQATGLLKTIADIKAVPVKSLETLKTITLDDVADVVLATELRTGASLVGDKEEVLGTVMMLSGENSRIVSLRVAEKIKEISETLPPGYKVKTLYNRSDLVNSTLGTVEHNLLTGAALVILVLLLLVGNLRAAIVTAIMIPLSLLFTFIVMRYFGISGNLMSLGALDFGIIVDGAVIVLDNCVRLIHDKTKALGRSLSKAELKESILKAAMEVRQAAGFGELIIVVIFLPLFALVGVEGKMFRPMAATFSVAVLGALVLSFTAAPALATLILKGNAEDKEPWLMEKIKHYYAGVLNWSLIRKTRIVAAGVFSVIAGALLFASLGGEFLPQLDEGSFVIQFVRPVNISIDQSVELQKKSHQIISSFPEIDEVFGRLGTAEIATDPMGVNLSDTYITLKNKSQWPKINGKKRTKTELTSAVVQKLEEELPGQRGMLSQPIQMRFNELLEGTRADISVKVFGDDMDKLSELTREIAAAIRSVRGAGDVELELRGKSPLLKVEPKNDYLNKLGVSNREVLETVGVAIGGEEVGSIFDGIKKFPIVIRLNEKNRSDLEAIRSLPVGVSTNSTIPLSEAAKVEFSETYGSISREQIKRRAAIMINPRGRDTESFVDEAQKVVSQKVKLPSGYYMEWGGNFKNLKEARSRLLVLAPLALILVLAMIYMAFQNLSQTLLIFSCVPLALVGGVLGLMMNRLPFSISAGVGFIALSGIAVLNGVVLMNYFNDLRKNGLSGVALVKEGTLIRLRPVLMTALVDIFGFLPMMLSSGVGSEVQRPLASVVIGGIVSSTALTLIVLPVLYCLFERKMVRQLKEV